MPTYKKTEALTAFNTFLFYAYPMIEEDQLDEGDLTDEGRCLRTGAYQLDIGGEYDPDTIKNSRDLFWHLSGIHDVENFRILIDVNPDKTEIPTSALHLGSYEMKSTYR
jgi:hypothetical protein